MGFLAGLSIPSAFNGGRSQVGFNFPGLGFNEFPYIDFVRFSGPMFTSGSSTGLLDGSPLPPLNNDANGYPITVPGTGYFLQVDIPPTLAITNVNTAKTGQYVLAWKGTAAVNVSGFTSVGSSKDGRVLFTPTSTSGVQRLTISIASMDAVDYITKVSVYALSDETAYLAGTLWNPDFIARLRQSKHAVLRFMNWLQNNTTNVTDWASRKGKDHFTQANYEARTSLWAGESTQSGFDYGITFGSGAPVHGTMMHLRYGGTYTPASSSAIAAFTGNAIPWTAHGLSGGEIVALGSSNGQPSDARWVSDNLYVLASGLTTDSFQVSLTPGGAAANLGTKNVGSTVTAIRVPTLNLNSTGAIAVRNQYGDPLTTALRKVNAGDGKALFGTVIYDSEFNSWLNFGPSSDGGYSGITSGISPEHMLDLCVTVGAHPWLNMPYLSVSPMTDYVTGLATFFHNNAPAWMIPRYGGINEQWNFAGGFYGTRYGWSKGWVYWGTFFDQDNFQGKYMSTVGQAISAVYGGKLDGRRFWVVDGCQFGGFANAQPTALSNRFLSGQYIAQAASAQSGYVKAPAKLYCTHLCIANYFNSAYIDVGHVGTGSITSNTLTMAARDNTGNYKPIVGDKIYLQGSTTVPSGVTSSSIATITAILVDSASVGQYTVTSVGDVSSQKIVIGPDLSETVMALKYYNNPDSSLLDAYIGGCAFAGTRVDSLVGNAATYDVAKRAGQLYRNKDGYQLILTFYEGGYSPDYTSTAQVNSFRAATKNSPELTKAMLGGTFLNGQTINGNYNDATANGVFPSMYEFGGPNSAWGVLDPTIYVTPDPPQWTAAATYNA